MLPILTVLVLIVIPARVSAYLFEDDLNDFQLAVGAELFDFTGSGDNIKMFTFEDNQVKGTFENTASSHTENGVFVYGGNSISLSSSVGGSFAGVKAYGFKIDSFVDGGGAIFTFYDLQGNYIDYFRLTSTDPTFAGLIYEPNDKLIGEVALSMPPDGVYFTEIYAANELSPTVPLPGAVWLLGSGLLGLVALRRVKKNA
jgi:hypothetical protein